MWLALRLLSQIMLQNHSPVLFRRSQGRKIWWLWKLWWWQLKCWHRASAVKKMESRSAFLNSERCLGQKRLSLSHKGSCLPVPTRRSASLNSWPYMVIHSGDDLRWTRALFDGHVNERRARQKLICTDPFTVASENIPFTFHALCVEKN